MIIVILEILMFAVGKEITVRIFRIQGARFDCPFAFLNSLLEFLSDCELKCCLDVDKVCDCSCNFRNTFIVE